MTNLSYIEKQKICRLFGITGGYAFKFWTERGIHDKTKTKDLILESCGINIFDDEDYQGLSQQKCIEKIWNTCSSHIVVKMLKAFCEYFEFQMDDSYWSEETWNDYNEVQTIIKRLEEIDSISLPDEQKNTDLNSIVEDIQYNIQNDTPELVIDRLHTYATVFFRTICENHGIPIKEPQGNYLSLHSLVGSISNWYKTNAFFQSEFASIAIKYSISIFEKYNALRNEQSAAHPNKLLNKAEAMFAVKIVSETLVFIDRIERRNSSENNFVNSISNDIDPDLDDLPF